MLSPGKYYERVPKGLGENLEYRLRAARCKEHDAVWEMCRRDILYYVNVFCWTFDPRTELKLLPFITWPIQDRAFLTILECIEKGRDLVIEKSRDMGASWMSLTAMEWLWHFHRGHSFLMVSRKEGLVDSPGDPDSLFWKVDFIHKHLPDWLRPAMDRRKLHFGNSDNGSTIDGESTTAAAGVGGRRTAMFIDEFSRIEEGYQLLAGTADTTRCRIFNFTPFGTSNAAYKLARRGDVRKLRLHWSDHPEKARGLYKYNEGTHQVDLLDRTYSHGDKFNFVMDGRLRSPWYDGECARRANDREVAQMLDIDYQGSSYQFFDRSLILDLQRTYAVPAYWEGDIAFDPDTGKSLGFVACKGGPLRLWLNLDANGRPPASVYVAGGDLSAGTGSSNSCISIVDAKTGEKVGEYTTPYLRPDQLAPRAVALCWAFKDVRGEGMMFCWEQAGPGVVFGKKVLELGYRNVYFRRNEVGLKRLVSDNPGWAPTNDNKRVMLEEYRSDLASRRFLNRSAEALEECLAFIHTKDGNVEHSEMNDLADPTGAKGNHGDRVIADGLACKMARGTDGTPRRVIKEEAAVGSMQWRREREERKERQAAAY